MIITDEIRNIWWYDLEGPLETAKVKLFDELLALAILRYCYPEKYNHFKKVEKPDLQHTDRKSGVEVTSAINEVIASIEGNYAKYRTTIDPIEKARLKSKIEKVGGRFDSVGLSFPTEDSLQDKKVFETVIEKKVKKLAVYQKNGFEKMELFILHSNIPCIYSKNTFIELFEKANGYETVYFSAPSCLMVYQYADKHLLIKKIPEKDYTDLKTIARLTVDGKIKPDDSIWKTPAFYKHG